MNQELKDRWVGALRGDDYEQGRKRLRCNDDMYCCLGVLADIHDPSLWEEELDGWFYVDMEGELPSDMEELALGQWNDRGTPRDVEGHLIAMNDGGKTFDTIANWIEVHVAVTE